MTKQEFLRVNKVNQMPLLVQALAGRLYDAAFHEGRKVGHREGVDAVYAKERELYDGFYSKGADDARKQCRIMFAACLYTALHRRHGFGPKRVNALLDDINQDLHDMIDPSEAVRRADELGLHLGYDDPLAGELDGWEEEA